jgi:hypothetical protein
MSIIPRGFWVDPNLLSIVGVGLSSDLDVPDGRHLRWFIGATLGFPRSGLLLQRHASKVNVNWDPAGPPDPLIQQSGLAQTDLGFGSLHRFDNGLTVAKAGGFAYTTTAPNTPPMLRVDAVPVTCDFGISGPGSPPFLPSPHLSQPAAFVRLTILRRKQTGFAVATGSYDARGSLIVQDSGIVGFERTLSFAERRMDPYRLACADDDAQRALERRGFLPRPPSSHSPGLAPIDPNGWVTQTVLLHGGWLDHIEITGTDAVLARIQWIPVRDYAGSPGWDDVETFFLPLTDDPSIYPAWTTKTGEEVMKERLLLAPPRRNVPWDDPSRPVDANLVDRYMGDTAKTIDDAMRLFLKGQVSGVIPQSYVEVEQTLDSTGPGEPETVKALVRPFDHLYAAAADPQVARMLGLMTTDTTDPGGVYDYTMTMGVSPLWTEWALFPEQAELDAKVLRDRGIDGGFGVDKFTRPDGCLAMVTAIRRDISFPPSAPADLQARVDHDVSLRPVQARVELNWQAESMTLFASDPRARVFYTLSRSGASGDVFLHHKDEDSGLLMPHLPTRRQPSDGRLRLVDNEIPDWGLFTWRLRGMDVWGRFSPEANVTVDVQDIMPPPAPTSIEAALVGDSSGAPTWTSLFTAFDWSAGQALLAPDLDRFEIHLRQGEVDRAIANTPSTWGHFEHVAGAVAPPVILRWPALTLESLPAGLTGTVSTEPIPAEEGGGVRILINIGPVQAAFDATDRAVVSVTVRAIDTFANASAFGAHAAAIRFNEAMPPVPQMPGDVAIASRPDATGLSSFTIDWPDLGGGHVRVLRVAGRTMLAAVNQDMDAYDALDRPAQAGLLRGLALTHEQLFNADHEYPYLARAGSHRAMLPAKETGLTVFMIEPVNASGQRTPWPTDPHAFLVVAVPRLRPAEPPLVREVRAGDRRVTVRIAPSPTGDVAAFRVYRARSIADVQDVRRMRVIGEQPPASSDDTIFEDEGLYPDVDYWYRAVAVLADGTLSPPSAPVRVRPFSNVPPPPPSVLAVVRTPATPKRQITAVIPRRDLPLVLLRRGKGLVDWQAASGPHIGPGGLVDVMALSPLPVAAGYELTIVDEVAIAPDERYVYRLRLRDALGRFAESAMVEEAP